MSWITPKGGETLWIKFNPDPMSGTWPENGQSILAVCDCIEGGDNPKMLTGEFTCGSGRFRFYASDEISDVLLYWMPLPEMPK